MKKCDDCKYAKWERDSAGRLHINKQGRCTFKIKMPVLPNAYYFMHKPLLAGGYIERGREHEKHCPCYAPE